jgi:hypothetical protein
MPALALSRVGARVVESGPDGDDLAAGAWQRLEELPDPRSPRGRVYPLACYLGEGGLDLHGGGGLHGDSEQIISASNAEKSVVAGVDIGWSHGYSFSRSPERR